MASMISPSTEPWISAMSRISSCPPKSCAIKSARFRSHSSAGVEFRRTLPVTAREISRADQKLTAAVSEMVAEASGKLDSENRTMLQTAADDFAEQGSFLRQEARSFNQKAEKAEALYEKLPTRFVLPQPDVYEGI